ncbi:MAG: MlaD family protein [Fimbriimonadales bacterium]
MASAWKIGLFVIVFGALLIAGFSVVGNSLFKKPVDTYYGDFADIGGLQAGTMVTMAGVKIGSVSDVDLLNPKIARAKLSIEKGTFIPTDAKLTVPTPLFSLGEATLQVITERGKDAGKLPVGSTIPAVKGSLLKTILPEGEQTFRELTETLKATRDLLSDPELRGRIKGVLTGTEQTLVALNKVLGQTHTIISQNQGTLRSALLNASSAIQDLRHGIATVTKQVADTDLPGNAQAILASLNNTAKRAENLVAEVNRFVADPNMRTALNNTMANLEQVSRTGIDIAENTKAMTADGKIVTAKAIELADAAQAIAVEAKDLLTRLNQFVGKLPGTGIKLERPSLLLETGRNFDTDRFQTDVFFNYPLSEKSSIFAGVYDATESNQLTVQYSQLLGKNAIRYGIYASKPGVGVDLQPTPRLSLTGDLFDPNDLKFNMRARFLFGDDIYGWVGLDRIFDRNSAIIGIGVKR